MLRAAAFLLLTASTCWSQFQNLAATDNGDRLYFSSPLRQTGSDQFLHPKIFEWNASEGFRLIAQREKFGPDGALYNFNELIQPDVSGNGSVLTFVGYQPPLGGSSSLFGERYNSYRFSGENESVALASGRIQVSRNGRYAAAYGSTLFSAGAVGRIDLETGDYVPAESGIMASNRQAITSNGELLLNGFGNPGLFVLWAPSSQRRLLPDFVVAGAIISDDGSRIVFHAVEDEGYSLWAARTDGTDARQLAARREQVFSPAISNDGRWVVFETGGAAVLVDLVSGDSRELVAPPDGVSETTISGLGNVVFLATFSNRLLRVDPGSGAIDELVPRIPVLGPEWTPFRVVGAAVPGSLNWIRGSGLAERLSFAAYPLPESLGGVEVLLGDLPARIVAVAPEQVVYQIPFEVPLGENSVRLPGPPAPFEGPSLELELKPQALQFVRNGYEAWAEGLPIGANIVVNQSFTRLITETQPAAPEEIVHLYATGGGEVAVPVKTGEPAPVEPLPVVSTPVECFQIDGFDRKPLETFYVGLAPSLVGVYQVTVRLPKSALKTFNDPTLALVQIGCGQREAAGFFDVFMRLEP